MHIPNKQRARIKGISPFLLLFLFVIGILTWKILLLSKFVEKISNEILKDHEKTLEKLSKKCYNTITKHIRKQ